MCCPRTPFRLPEKVQAAFQCHKTVQKQPAHSKAADKASRSLHKPSAFRTQGKLASRYELDPLGRLKRQIATLNDLAEGGKGKTKVAAGYGQTAVKRSYGYDRTGNLTHSTDQRTGTTHFEHDKLGRITQAGNELFAFDPAHNILSDGRSAVPDNRLKTYNGTTYYYDDLGNLIHRELADGEVQNYFYDLHDQLVKAEIFKKDGSKETWAYTYDALGRRIGKGRLKDGEVLGSLENQTRFVWDGSHLLQEVQLDGRYTYIYTDPDSYEPLAQVREWTTEDGEKRQQTHYFHCDQIGIPREMTDKDGNLLWFGNYTGWGRLKEETKVTDSAYQPFRLQNQYADRETGLHYNFFRYYEPECGRFINQDPIGLAGGSNLYWALQNSQMWADPLGLSSKKSPGTCNDPCAGQDPAGEAAGWQGSKDYPGVDNWKNVVLEKGTILFTLYPHGPAGMASAPGNYFVRGYAVRSARGNARAFNDSVQVRHSGNANAARDMRKQLHIFVVEEDICVGKSKAKANKKYGDGGATQYYIRDIDKPKLTSTGKLRSFRR